MKTILAIIAGLFLLIVISIVGVLGYFGFIPGVSKIFGSDQPRDLGVTYSYADYTSYMDKATSHDLPSRKH